MRAREMTPLREERRFSPSAVLSGVTVSLSATALAAAVLAGVFAFTPLTEKVLPGVAVVVGPLITFIGGFATGRKTGYMGWVHGGVTGTVYALVCLLFGAVAFPAILPASMVLKRLALGFAAGALGGVVGVNL